MGDFGIKISEVTKDVNTSSLADTSFDSRYHSLMLMEKKTMQFTAEQGETAPSGTATYTHSFGYAPFTLGYVSYTTDSLVTDILPHYYTSTFGGSGFDVTIDLSVTTTEITMNWSADQYTSGTPEALDDDVVFTVTLHIYSLKLGYTT